jgi:hypothetical protein
MRTWDLLCFLYFDELWVAFILAHQSGLCRERPPSRLDVCWRLAFTALSEGTVAEKDFLSKNPE